MFRAFSELWKLEDMMIQPVAVVEPDRDWLDPHLPPRSEAAPGLTPPGNP